MIGIERPNLSNESKRSKIIVTFFFNVVFNLKVGSSHFLSEQEILEFC